MGDLNNKYFISHYSGGWKSEIKVPAWLGSGEDSFLGLQTADFSWCSYSGGDQEWERERDRMFSNMSSDKGTDLFRLESCPHDLTNHITSQIFHFQQPSHWALGLQSTKFGATTNIQSITLPFLTSTILNCLFKSCLFLCWFVCLLLT